MNTRPTRRGVSIMELLVYMAVLVVLLNAAALAYYRCWDHTTAVLRNADDIVRAMEAGERWRDELRAATAPPRLVDGILHVPHAGGDSLYRFAHEAVARKASGEKGWTPFLAKVAASRMQLDKGRHVDSWRWELELKVRKKKTPIRPLFTFRAVPGTAR